MPHEEVFRGQQIAMLPGHATQAWGMIDIDPMIVETKCLAREIFFVGRRQGLQAPFHLPPTIKTSERRTSSPTRALIDLRNPRSVICRDGGGEFEGYCN